jgi:hypothetical protein
MACRVSQLEESVASSSKQNSEILSVYAVDKSHFVDLSSSQMTKASTKCQPFPPYYGLYLQGPSTTIFRQQNKLQRVYLLP